MKIPKKKEETEKIFAVIMNDINSRHQLIAETKSETLESQRYLSRINTKKSRHCHVIIKLHKIKDIEKILKVTSGGRWGQRGSLPREEQK